MIYPIFTQIILGLLIADFISGFFHWLEDRVFNSNMPIIGKHIVEPNRLHHRDQTHFIRESNFWQRNAGVFLVSIIIGLFLLFLFGFSWILLSTFIFAFFANEIHAYSHKSLKQNNSFVRMLQEMGLFQTPIQHAKHHKGKNDTCYCVITNFLNPILDRIRFWEILENILTFIGLEPNKGVL